ncbi:hypothetical protein IC232_04120 [Microvirga sp. BT688]|uniref:hypothetical protein n=1 Tax=Microvirga sp. TaxID=1873136 RepID=UPI0016894CA9|nr:hypothetical protein [Microvirga sp.]MBD2745879.1 hypothetical protein [Microvirga sp.]
MSSLLGATISAVAIRPAAAGELYIYEHNLSVIDWFVVGDKIKATYSKPKASLAAAGVKEGAVLFEGDYEGNRIIGTAYAFKSGCAPAPYQVIGMEQGSQIVLRGPGPVRSKTGCDVVGYSAKSPHAELKFNYSATHH